MENPSDYNIEVESILGGLESALARGQPLKKAMTSFRNAGYKEDNIIEAAKKFQILHRRRFYELGVDPNKPQKRIQGAVVSQYGTPEEDEEKKKEEQKPKELVPAQTREKLIEEYEREKIEMESRRPQKRIQDSVRDSKKQDKVEKEKDKDLSVEERRLEKTIGEMPDDSEGKVKKKPGLFRGKDVPEKPEEIEKVRKTQVVSGYGDEALQASENFKAAIQEMVQSLSKLPLAQAPPSGKRQKPQVINKISNYGMKPPTPVNKAVTFLLIFLLILLLGVLAAVFFFREELIDLFNTFALEYLMPLFL
jgi:site-specific DNA-cytosine methylase